MVLNHPFAGTKYARRIGVLPDGNLQLSHENRKRLARTPHDAVDRE